MNSLARLVYAGSIVIGSGIAHASGPTSERVQAVIQGERTTLTCRENWRVQAMLTPNGIEHSCGAVAKCEIAEVIPNVAGDLIVGFRACQPWEIPQNTEIATPIEAI